MKKTIVVLAMVFLSSMAAQAQTGGQKGQADQGMMGEGQQMPMMQSCMPMMKQMMKQMMGQGAMMQDMMQMMTDMMKMQQNMMEGMKPAEKKKAADLSQMMEKMDTMMVDMKSMMSQGMMMQGMMGGTASAETKKEEQTGGPQKTVENTEAGVTVKATLEAADGAVTFKIALETHTVGLDQYKFDEIAVLRAGGKEYPARVKSQEGSGHHRSAVIEFDNPGTKEFEVVVRDVAGVKERVLKFSR